MPGSIEKKKSDVQKLIMRGKKGQTERRNLHKNRSAVSPVNFTHNGLLSRKHLELASEACLDCKVQQMESVGAGEGNQVFCSSHHSSMRLQDSDQKINSSNVFLNDPNRTHTVMSY